MHGILDEWVSNIKENPTQNVLFVEIRFIGDRARFRKIEAGFFVAKLVMERPVEKKNLVLFVGR